MPRSALRAILVLALLGAAAPPGATAKEVSRVLACGADGCTDVTARAPRDEAFLDTSIVGVRPDHRAPFVTLRITMAADHRTIGHWSVAYVAARGVLRTDGAGQPQWARVLPAQQRVLDRLVRGVRPHPAVALRLGPREPATAPAPPPPLPTPARSTAAAPGLTPAGGTPTAAIAAALAAVVVVAALLARRRGVSLRAPRSRA